MSTTQQEKAPLFNRSSRSKLESQILRSSDIESHRSTSLLDQSLISAKRQIHAIQRTHDASRIFRVLRVYFSILDSVSVICYCASVECLLMNKAFALALCVLTLKDGCVPALLYWNACPFVCL